MKHEPHISPHISIVMPVHNARGTVETALRSILNGTYQSLELIAVDDGSTDGSEELLARIASADPRVVLIRQSYRGVASALNAGLRACRGRFIGRMDADDWSTPNRLARQVELLADNPDLALVSCLVEVQPPGGRLTDGMSRYQRWINGLIGPDAIARARFVESPVAHPSVLARRRVFEDGYREGTFPEDYDLWLRRLAAGDRFAKVPDVLLRWRDAPDRLSRTHPAYSDEAFFRLKLDHLLHGPLREGRSAVVWGAGPIGKRWLKALLASGVRVPYLVEIDRRKIGRRIHGAEVIAPDRLPEVRGSEVVLAAVGVDGAREEIRAWLVSRGLEEGRDFWAVC